MNVPRAEKQDLDVKKWIWSGDVFEEPKDTEKASMKITKNTGAQTPAEWMTKVLESVQHSHNNLSISARKLSHQTKRPPKNQ